MCQSIVNQLGISHSQKKTNAFDFFLLLLTRCRLTLIRQGLLVILTIISIGAFSEKVEANDFSGNSLELSVQDALITAQISNQPLKHVLRELTRKTHIIVYLPNAAAERKVSVTFKSLPLAQGIVRILGRHNYVMKFSPKSFENGEVDWLKILGNQASPENSKIEKIGESVKVAKFENISATNREKPLTESIDEALTAPEPEVRAAVLESLIGEEGEEPEIRKALLVSLEDESTRVRNIALDRLSEMVEPVPFAVLSDTFLTDSDTNIRREALLQLIEKYQDNATPLVQQALKDSDETVRDLAKSIIDLQ